MSSKFTFSTGNVFADIGFSQPEAKDLQLRSKLLMALQNEIVSRTQSQAEIAELLGISQPRVSNIRNGKLHLFSLETLVDLLERLGQSVNMTIRPKDVPESVFYRSVGQVAGTGLTVLVDTNVIHSSVTSLALGKIAISGVSLITGAQAFSEICRPQTQTRVVSANTQLALAA